MGGPINPYHPDHYADGQWHEADDFPGSLGLFWLGRLYLSKDGQTAFYTSMSIAAPHTCDGLLKADSPYIAPVPNSNNFGDTGVESLYDERLLYTFMLAADVLADGTFANVRQLPGFANRGGVNFVYDAVTADAVYVGHMTLDDEFWSHGGGPDSMVLDLSQQAAWDVEPWDGVIERLDLATEEFSAVSW